SQRLAWRASGADLLPRPYAGLRRTRASEPNRVGDDSTSSTDAADDYRRRANQQRAERGSGRSPVTGRLGRITVFPIKSLDGVSAEEVRVRGGAGLERDREYRMVGEDGEVLNTKGLGERLVAFRSDFSLVFGEVAVQLDGRSIRVR